MDLDSALLRAFVATADERHFTRAAQRLHLSQQALSKRVQRLEDLLSVRLLRRTHQQVDLTAAGERLLPHARAAIDSVDAAVAAVRGRQRALIVDVLDEHVAPLRLIDQAVRDDPSLAVDVTMRTTAPALSVLRDGAADVVFGRAGALGPAWPEDVWRRPVLLERIGVLVGADHRLAQHELVTMDDLRGERLWFPLMGSPPDWIEFLEELVRRFGLNIDYSGSTRGFSNFISQAPARATFFGLAMQPPADDRVRVIPIVEPAPVFAWWVMWTRRIPTKRLDKLTSAMATPLPADLAFASDHQQAWLPDSDRAYLAQDTAGRRASRA